MDPQEQKPVQINPPKDFLHRHILAEILAVVIFAAIISGIYYWQTSSSVPDLASFLPAHHQASTANWKVYTNNECGFKLTLTDAWKGYSAAADSKNPCFLTFYVPDQSNPENYQELLTIVRLSYKDYQGEVDSLQRGDEGEHPFFIGSNDKFGYVYNLSQDPVSQEEKYEIDKVMANLEIIDSLDTSTWKSYTNSQYGFEIKYPNSWYSIADNSPYNLIINSEPIPLDPQKRDYLYSLGVADVLITNKPYIKGYVEEPECSKLNGNLRVDTVTVEGKSYERCYRKFLNYYYAVGLIHNNNLFNFYFKDGTNINTANQILSTFKFTK